MAEAMHMDRAAFQQACSERAERNGWTVNFGGDEDIVTAWFYSGKRDVAQAYMERGEQPVGMTA